MYVTKFPPTDRRQRRRAIDHFQAFFPSPPLPAKLLVPEEVCPAAVLRARWNLAIQSRDGQRRQHLDAPLRRARAPLPDSSRPGDLGRLLGGWDPAAGRTTGGVRARACGRFGFGGEFPAHVPRPELRYEGLVAVQFLDGARRAVDLRQRFPPAVHLLENAFLAVHLVVEFLMVVHFLAWRLAAGKGVADALPVTESESGRESDAGHATDYAAGYDRSAVVWARL